MKESDICAVRGNAAKLLAYIRAVLDTSFGEREIPDQTGLPPLTEPLITLCLTVHANGLVRACYAGSGQDLKAACRRAVRSALKDDRHGGRLVFGELSQSRLEIWVKTSCEPIETMDLNLVSGEYGVEIIHPLGSAFYLPSVAVTNKITFPKTLFQRLSRKAGLQQSAWQDPDATLYRTTWLQFVECHNKVVEFIRCRPPVKSVLDSSVLKHSLIQIGIHTSRLQLSNGDYTYLYNPLTDEKSNENSHPVRIIGTSYAMSRLTQFLADDKVAIDAVSRFGSCTRRALDHLVNDIVANPRGFGSYVRGGPEGIGLLGCTAMTILALQSSWARDIYALVRDELVAGLLSLQSDIGWFPNAAQNPSIPGNQEFYPGESLLALANEHLIQPQSTIERAFNAAFKFYHRYFQEAPSPYFASWQVKAWATFHQSVPHPEYAQFVFEQLDWLAPAQYNIEDSVPADYVGGFILPNMRKGAMPTFLSAVFTEAFIHGMKVASRISDLERHSRYQKIVESGLSFLLRLQIRDEGTIYINNPYLAVGGITHSLENFQVRCDYNFHAMTCLIAAVDTLYPITVTGSESRIQ